MESIQPHGFELKRLLPLA